MRPKAAARLFHDVVEWRDDDSTSKPGKFAPRPPRRAPCDRLRHVLASGRIGTRSRIWSMHSRFTLGLRRQAR
jgi:hypothetical protein